MSAVRIIALSLILLSVMALAYGGLTPLNHPTDPGVISSSEGEERGGIPTWLGAGAFLVGGLLFMFGGARSRL